MAGCRVGPGGQFSPQPVGDGEERLDDQMRKVMDDVNRAAPGNAADRQVGTVTVAGSHAATSRAATARDPKRHKQGRIVSGAAAGAPTEMWLTPGHRRAKTITNCVANRWGYGPDTPAGVRDRVARERDPALNDLLARVDDETIALAIRGVRDLERRWMAVPSGGKLRLSWPLPPDFFAEATGNPGPDP